MHSKNIFWLLFLTVLLAFSEKAAAQRLEFPKGDFHAFCRTEKARLTADLRAAKTPFEKKAAQKAFKQFGRWQQFWTDYVGNDGRLPQRLKEFETYQLQPNSPVSPQKTVVERGGGGGGSWSAVGPFKNVNPHGYAAYPGMGRLNVARRLGASSFIVGSPNGGIWKTTDNGATWQPKLDALARTGITDLRINPANPNIIYAMTGDRDGTHSATVGVIRSNDAGETWNTTGLVIAPEVGDVFFNSSLGVKPNAPANLCVAANGKVYWSNNGGSTFSESNLEIAEANDLLFDNDFVLISTTIGDIFRSTDNGQTFEKIYETADTCVMRFNQRVVHGHVYFFKGLKNDGHALRISVAEVLAATAGAPIEPEILGESIGDFNPQGNYNIAFAVSPDDENSFYAAGVDGYFTTDGGQGWIKRLDAYDSPTSGELYVHPDHHFADFDDATTLLICHDGGISLVNTAADPFVETDLTGEGLLITQIYHAAISPADQNNENILLGLQDNDGFSKSPNTLGGEWVAASAGDGTATAINQNDPKTRFLGGTNGQLSKTITAFQANYEDQKVVIAGDPDGLAPFVCEAVIHDQNPDHVFAGHLEMKFSTDGGETFEDVPTDFRTGGTVEIEQHGDRIANVGYDGQKIADYADGTFSNLFEIEKPAGIDQFFNSISLSTPSAQTVFATIGGYEAGQKVFKSTDNGANWENVSGNLPNVIAKKVVSKATNLGTADEVLFLATNVGVYFKIGSASAVWAKLGDNLPVTDVNDLDINYVTDKLLAATYGRGLWEISIGQLMVATENAADPLAGIEVLPNPITSGEALTLKIPAEIGSATGAIFNFIGGKMHAFSVGAGVQTVALPRLAAGAYLIVFEKNGRQSAQKLIVKS